MVFFKQRIPILTVSPLTFKAIFFCYLQMVWQSDACYKTLQPGNSAQPMKIHKSNRYLSIKVSNVPWCYAYVAISWVFIHLVLYSSYKVAQYIILAFLVIRLASATSTTMLQSFPHGVSLLQPMKRCMLIVINKVQSFWFRKILCCLRQLLKFV